MAIVINSKLFIWLKNGVMIIHPCKTKQFQSNYWYEDKYPTPQLVYSSQESSKQLQQFDMDKPAKITITLSECEHSGDLDNYKADIIASGGRVVEYTLYTDIEECKIVIEVDNLAEFKKKFSRTDTYKYQYL